MSFAFSPSLQANPILDIYLFAPLRKEVAEMRGKYVNRLSDPKEAERWVKEYPIRKDMPQDVASVLADLTSKYPTEATLLGSNGMILENFIAKKTMSLGKAKKNEELLGAARLKLQALYRKSGWRPEDETSIKKEIEDLEIEENELGIEIKYLDAIQKMIYCHAELRNKKPNPTDTDIPHLQSIIALENAHRQMVTEWTNAFSEITKPQNRLSVDETRKQLLELEQKLKTATTEEEIADTYRRLIYSLANGKWKEKLEADDPSHHITYPRVRNTLLAKFGASIVTIILAGSYTVLGGELLEWLKVTNPDAKMVNGIFRFFSFFLALAMLEVAEKSAPTPERVVHTLNSLKKSFGPKAMDILDPNGARQALLDASPSEPETVEEHMNGKFKSFCAEELARRMAI